VSLKASPPAPEPRWGTPRRAERGTRGPVLTKVALLLGWIFHPWQGYVGDVALEVHASGIPYYRTVGISIARQNGKTLLLLARIAMELFGRNRTVIYTAQDRQTARRKWEEMCRALISVPSFAKRVVHWHTNNGQEELLLDTGSTFIIVTPNEKAGRSLSVDLAIVDEAFAHRSMDIIGAIAGTMAARTHAQLWITSNAGTSESVLFRHYTTTGRAQVDSPVSPMAWFEWVADESVDVLDREGWEAANPSLDLPHGVVSAHLAEQALTIDGDRFRREYLNHWVDLDILTGIDAVTWAACRDDTLVPAGRIALALDMTPERDRGALVAAGDIDGRTPLEVIEHTSDIDRLVTRTVEIASRNGALVVLDRGNPASSAVPALERAGVEVRMIPAPDFARACGDFYDAARFARLSHRGDYRLADAVLGATKRAMGEAWVWRRRGPSDISPLIAATLARWGVVGTPAPLIPRVW
jgi:Terminase large subunit, T4likevirus-type, N-terminal